MNGFPVNHLVFNIVIWILWLITFRLLLPHKYAHWVTYLCEMLFFIPYYGVTMLARPDYSVFSLLVGEAFILLTLVIFHDGKLRFKILIWLAVFIIALIGDMFTYYVSNMANTPSEIMAERDYPIWQYLVTLTINIILLTMFILGGMTLRKQFAWELNAPQMALFLLYPISQTILLIYWLTILWNDIAKYNKAYLLLPIILCILTDFILFILIRKTAKTAAVESRVHLLEAAYEHQESYYQQLADDYDKAIRIRSTLIEEQNQILHLIADKKADEAVFRMDEISRSQTLSSGFPECRNRTLASFLRHRQDDLTDKGIQTSFSVSIPIDLSISDPDLICLFGNLLDNAAEACESVDTPAITCHVDFISPYLRVRLDNTVSASANPHKKRIPDLERGIGYRILTNLTEKYDGEFRTAIENDQYKATVLWKGIPS